jgi:hypothetical protein
MHSPWYNTNTAHHDEFNTVLMRTHMEGLFHKHEVNAAFCGHVHAYERTSAVFNNATSAGLDSGTVYLNIGDGGNREGHSDRYLDLPEWSAYRNGTQYGHSRMDVLNATHAVRVSMSCTVSMYSEHV